MTECRVWSAPVRRFHLFPLLITLSLAGCAFSEDVARFDYVPNASQPVQGAGPIMLTVTDGRTSFRTRIAMKQNGYGMDGAAIRAPRPVTDIVHDALAAELTQRGFAVAADGRPVGVSVTMFYTFFGTGVPSGSAVASLAYSGDAHGQVGLTVQVAGPHPFSRHYDGVGNATVLLTSGGNAARTLTDGLHDVAAKMFADPEFVAAITGLAGVMPAGFKGDT